MDEFFLILLLLGIVAAGIAMWAFSTPADFNEIQSLSPDLSNLGLVDIVCGSNWTIGLNKEKGRILLIPLQGDGRWIAVEKLAAVAITPIVESVGTEQSISRTNRGSQALSAGVGAVIAGPIGLLAGAATGSRSTTTRISSSDRVVAQEFSLRIRDDQLPFIKIKCFPPFDSLERLHARLENIVDKNSNLEAKPVDEFDEIEPAIWRTIRSPKKSWWERTFG